MADKHVWHHLGLAYLIPVAGGLITYFMKKDKDRKLANFCLVNSVVHPFLIGLITGLLFTALRINDPFSLITLTIMFLFGFIFSLLSIRVLFRENRYRYMVAVFWFGLFGAAYAYLGPYKKEKRLRSNVWGLFAIVFVASMMFTGLSAAIEMYDMGLGEEYVKPSLLCSVEISDEWSAARDAYNMEIDKGGLILERISELYPGEDYFSDVPCESATEFIPLVEELIQWDEGSYLSSMIALVAANEKIKDCDPYIYSGMDGLIAENDEDINLIMTLFGLEMGRMIEDCQIYTGQDQL